MTASPPAQWLPLEGIVPAELFKDEVRAWARRLGVTPREIHLRPMSRKWASCSSNGRLSFNTEVLSQAAQFRAEVIAHELLHLKVPNHGLLFRALLRAHLAEGRVQVEGVVGGDVHTFGVPVG
jgi:hypothetical protein